MSPHASETDACRKRGVVMTCYVDGHKRFRATSTLSSDHLKSGDPASVQEGGLQANPAEANGVLRRFS